MEDRRWMMDATATNTSNKDRCGEEMSDEGRKTKKISSVRELEVYKLAFKTAMEIFEISKTFPKEERYSLAETQTWLEFALACDYIDKNIFKRLVYCP